MKSKKRFIIFASVLVACCGFGLQADAWQYTVEPGDSMWKISQNSGITLKEMIRANPQVEDPNLIYPDEVLEVPSGESAEYADETAAQMLALVNACRAENGLAPLVLSDRLSAVASAKADDMATNGYFSHTSPTYGTPSQMLKDFGISYGYMGENIAKGYTDAASTVSAWMNSAGHRANILGTEFTSLGVGYNAQSNIWVQIFVG